MDLVAAKKADIVIISALPPAAVSHARYLCKRLHLRFPQTKLVIGLWTIRADLEKAKARISCRRDDAVVATFSDAMHEVQQLVHPLLLEKSEAHASGDASAEQRRRAGKESLLGTGSK